MTEATTLFKGTSFSRAKRDLLAAIKKAKDRIKGVRKTSAYQSQKMAEQIGKLRGRPLFYPAILSGLGHGPLAELVDGSVKYDFITGIGTHFFGHSDLDLLSVAVEASSQSIVMQGHLQMGKELKEFLEVLLRMSGDRLKYGWSAMTGTDANENALKVIRHKKTPAYKVIAFKNCFHGRSVIMADITDQTAYKKGLYEYRHTFYVPFFDPQNPNSIDESERILKDILNKNKEEICAFIFELVQGEGGFNTAPKDFFTRLMNVCRESNVAIWIDEIQTVGRTGELFAFQKLGLEEYVDVVTVGKMLQTCATLYTEEYNPQPGLLAGTFGGSHVALAVGKRILERLQEENFFGKNGKIAKMEKWILEGLQDLPNELGHKEVSRVGATGTMASWQFRDGSLEITKKLILRAFEEGVMSFYCGRGPYKIRFLLPGGVLEKEDYKKAIKLFKKVIKGV